MKYSFKENDHVGENYEITETLECDKKSVTIRGIWDQEIIVFLKNSPPDSISLYGIEWDDLTVLAPIAKYIKKLKFTNTTVNGKGIEKFTKIEYLLLDQDIDVAPNFLSNFKKIKEVVLSWSKKYSSDLFELPLLQKLQLRYFDETDCRKISVSNSIEELAIYESKLRCLDGLDKVKSLKKLDIAYIRVLEEITALKELPLLEQLEIKTCPRVSDLSPIKSLTKLKHLSIEKLKSASFEDLDWLVNLKNLKIFFNDAEVKNLNWEVIFKNKSIKDFSTRTHEGYMVTDEELYKIASKVGRVITSIDRFPPKKNPSISIMFDITETEWAFSRMFEAGTISLNELLITTKNTHTETLKLLEILDIPKEVKLSNAYHYRVLENGGEIT